MNTEAGLNKDREEEVGKGGLGTKKRGQLGQTEKLGEVLSKTEEFGDAFSQMMCTMYMNLKEETCDT